MSANKTLTVKCPNCHKAVEWHEHEPFKPFCSERCKLIDLGDWAMENNAIAGESVLTNVEESDETFLH